jgi:AcrR family transcriptional regulator
MDKPTAGNVPLSNVESLVRRVRPGRAVEVKTEESTTRKPLDRSGWIAGAIDALADEGVAGMCVEALAKRFGVTKGSFYWHFKDRQELLGAVLAAWKEGRIREDGSDVSAADEGQKLRKIIDAYGNDRREIVIELAVRDWARRDAQAAAAVEAVDRRRLENACRLFVAEGYGVDEAMSRSRLLYAYLLGDRLLVFDRQPPKIADSQRWIAELIAPNPVNA